MSIVETLVLPGHILPLQRPGLPFTAGVLWVSWAHAPSRVDMRGRGCGQTGGRGAAIPGVHDGVALELGKLPAQPGDPVDVVHILTIN